MKKIRMRLEVTGAHLGNPTGCRAGDVLNVEDNTAELYVRHGYAVLVEEPAAPKVEYAVAPKPETAAITTEDVAAPEKRGPGRPRKQS